MTAEPHPSSHVTLREIAAAIAANIRTVRGWPYLKGFPEPVKAGRRGTGGEAYWRWGAVREWLRETGRMDGVSERSGK